jgi:hypothetical protein
MSTHAAAETPLYPELKSIGCCSRTTSITEGSANNRVTGRGWDWVTSTRKTGLDNRELEKI